MSKISTTFFNENEIPLNEYPRPQFERKEWVNLNGKYEFTILPRGEKCPESFDGEILVPFAPESQLSGVVRHPTENDEMWYRRSFFIPQDFAGKRIILHFEAVDYECEVYINGVSVASHTGGYNPFEIDITDALTDGENVLTVRCFDPTDSGLQPRGKQTHKTHGFWYTATSGIWQTVWLEAVNEKYIKNIKLIPDICTKTLKICAATTGGTVRAEAISDGSVIATAEFADEGSLEIPDMRLWTPENPYLYDLKLTLISDGEIQDEVKSYFGMRSFTVEKDYKGLPRLCLNGKPYFQRGLLDQGYWCDGGLTAPSDEAMIFDIAKCKDLGFNMLRKHIKREPLRWYYHCDRLGMLVWQDMISGSDYVSTVWCGICPNLNITHLDDSEKNYWKFKRTDKAARDEFLREMYEMIDGLYNSTAICCWVPFNESWGQFDAYKVGTAVKNYDPTRFVDHASGWHDQGGPDFVSIHKYILPVTLPKKDENRPFVLSEYGGYSRICADNVWDKLHSFGYMMFASKESLTNAFVKLHEKQIIPLITKGLSATVYTQVSDVEWEVNGLFTYDRKVIKLDENAVREVNGKMRL